MKREKKVKLKVNLESKLDSNTQSKPKAATKRISHEGLIDKLYECAEKEIKDIRKITQEDFERFWRIELIEEVWGDEEDDTDEYDSEYDEEDDTITENNMPIKKVNVDKFVYFHESVEEYPGKYGCEHYIEMKGRTIKTLIKEHGIEKEAELFVKYYAKRISSQLGEYVGSLKTDHAKEIRKAAEQSYDRGCSRCGHRPSDDDY